MLFFFVLFKRKRKRDIIEISQDVFSKLELVKSKCINPLKQYRVYLTLRNHHKIRNVLYQLQTQLSQFLFFRKKVIVNVEISQTTSIDILLDEIKDYLAFLKAYNENYLRIQRERHSQFFDGTEFIQSKLNKEQIDAILTNDNFNLVVAGPGSGKTKLLTDRIAFYVLKRKILEEEILVLAYNRNAVKEVQKRLYENYNIKTVKVATFHGLGNSIIQGAHDSKYSKKLIRDKEKKLKEIIMVAKEENPFFQEQYITYKESYSRARDFLWREDSNLEAKMLYQQMKEYESLDGTRVKSFAEKEIADFFLKNGIKYEYEKIVNWCDNDADKEYKPDFFLTDYDIYLEHWAITKKNDRVPNWFLKSPKEYIKERHWKKRQFKKHGKVLWETDYKLWKGNQLHTKLLEYCQIYDIKFKPKNNHEIIELLDRTFADKSDDVIADLIINTITNIKVAGFDQIAFIEYIERKMNSLNTQDRAFFELVISILIRYTSFLEDTGQIDFEDMINKSFEIIRRDDDTLALAKYKMVLVDEFQDISLSRLRLLLAICNRVEDCRVFCVGDDWQSIYGFSGASNKYMIDIDNYIDTKCEQILLERNYRNPQAIIDYGYSIIRKCTDYIDKLLVGKESTSNSISIKRIIAKDDYDYREKQIEETLSLILSLLEEGVKDNEIMVLSRIGFGYSYIKDECNKNPDIEIEIRNNEGTIIRDGVRFSTVHKSKGLEAEHVIILNMFCGTYGFPTEIPPAYSYNLINPDLSLPNDEEKRLFFVGITRAKKKVYLFTKVKEESEFLFGIGPT